MKNILIGLILILNGVNVYGQGSGNAIKFTNNNSSVNLGNEVCNQVRTLELWFKSDVEINSNLIEAKTLIGRDYDTGNGSSLNEFALFFSKVYWGNSGKLVFGRRVGSSNHLLWSDENLWEENKWYHVAVTIDPVVGMKMYINGVLQQDTESSIQPIGTQTGSSTDDVHVGKWGIFNTRNFEGEIDELRIWEDSRTMEEVRANMCQSLTGNEQGLKAYYTFDDVITGNIIEDESINNNQANLNNISTANHVVSGAPIGNESVFLYTGSYLNHTLELEGIDSIEVYNIQTMAKGVHLYRVDEVPNFTVNIGVGNYSDYYGVFLSNGQGTYALKYNQVDCSSCGSLYTRHNNSIATWDNLPITWSCGYNQSITGVNMQHKEYIMVSGESINTTVDVTNTTLSSMQNGATYQWLICNEEGYSEISGATSQIFSPSQSGSYAVAIQVNDCIDTTECINFTSKLNIEDTSMKLADVFVINNRLYLDLKETYQPNETRVELYSINGQRIKEWIVNSPLTEQNLNLELGTYVITVYVGERKASYKISVM